MLPKKNLKGLIITITILWSIIASFTRKYSNETNWYHSTLWADKAGYYIYLPAVFIYQFDFSWAPDDFSGKFGDGFRIRDGDEKVITKYPYGVALLQLPFFTVAHLIAPLLDFPADGFSLIYNKLIDISCIVYFLLGALCLWKFLKTYYDERIIGILFLYLFFCTNLRYYVTIDTGLSHIYSFFLFSCFLLKIQTCFREMSLKTKDLIVISVLTALIFIVRPINIIFMPLFLLIDLESLSQLRQRLRLLLKARTLMVFSMIFIGFILPQIAYNHYSIGRLTLDSYSGETFSNLKDPQIARVLFAFENGLFVYNPLFLLSIYGMLHMLFSNKMNGLLSIILFSGLTFLYACWFSPQLGCGFGHRGFVEFYPFFIVPMGVTIQYLTANINKKILLTTLLLMIALYYHKLEQAWDICWFGKDPWDIDYWLLLLKK